jgi:hypothetical protein
MNNYSIEIMNCLSAMHLQEQKTPRCNNYFKNTSVVDETCRSAMVTWLCQISDALSLNRETVGIAMSLLDRFLSSCSMSSKQALEDRSKFQLAAITAYFIAVKINEPVELGVGMLVKLCRGCYEQSAILCMEQVILFSLEWRISSPTPLDFMRQILALLPSTEEYIVENVEHHLTNATKDSYFSTIAPSVVGAACVALSLKESNLICLPSEELMIWNKICKMLELTESMDFVNVQQTLETDSSLSGLFANAGRAITTLSKGSTYVNSGESSSPVSVNVSV